MQICLIIEFVSAVVCRDNNVDESNLEMYFTGDFEILGKYETCELKPGGAEIMLCESNKTEYLGYGARLMSVLRC